MYSAILEIEAIGDNSDQYCKMWQNTINTIIPGLGTDMIGWKPSYWCAKIIGLHPKWKFDRLFLKGKKDYSNANSKGSRGVTITYMLEEGCIYETKHPVSWRRDIRYFFKIKNGEIIKLEEDECKKYILELTCMKQQNNE